MATIRIPSTLRAFTSGRAEVKAAGANVGEVLLALTAEHPELRDRIFDANGAVRRYVNVFMNEEDIRYLKALETPVSEADRITLIPAMAGG